MRSVLFKIVGATVFGAAVAAIFAWPDRTPAILSAAAGLGAGFVVGLGVGERSKSAYCRELHRVNEQLAGLNDRLREENDRLAASPAATPEQR